MSAVSLLGQPGPLHTRSDTVRNPSRFTKKRVSIGRRVWPATIPSLSA